MRRRALVAYAGVLALFLLVQAGALALVQPFESAGYQPVEDPSDPTNSVLYLLLLLVATAAMLAAIRLGRAGVIRAFVLFATGSLVWFVLGALLAPLAAVGVPPVVAAGLGAAAVVAALWFHPEWYVLDAAGVVAGAGAAGLLGLGFEILPAVVLLVALAVYDAISVYGTQHMLTLASSVMRMRVPVLFVVPVVRGYSLLAEFDDAPGEEDAAGGEADAPADVGGAGDPHAAEGDNAATTDANGTESEDSADGADSEQSADGEASGAPALEERTAIFVGLGDAVMPTILVTSAAVFVDAPAVGGLPANLPAVGAAAGTLAGAVVLVNLVLRGRPHAGLPLLNGGAIAGYLMGALAVGIGPVEALGLAPYL